MLEIKVEDLEKVFNGLQRIIVASDQKPMDIPTDIQYWAFRLQKKLEGEFKALTEIKIPLLKRFATEIFQQQPGQMKKDEKGDMIPVTLPLGRYSFNSDEDRVKYEKEIKPIMDKVVTIESNIYKRSFKEIVELKLGGSLLFDLESILEEKEEKLKLVEKEEVETNN